MARESISLIGFAFTLVLGIVAAIPPAKAQFGGGASSAAGKTSGGGGVATGAGAGAGKGAGAGGMSGPPTGVPVSGIVYCGTSSVTGAIRQLAVQIDSSRTWLRPGPVTGRETISGPGLPPDRQRVVSSSAGLPLVVQ